MTGKMNKYRFASLLGAIMLFDVSAFGLLSLRGDVFDPLALLFGLLLAAALPLQLLLLRVYSQHYDRLLVVMANFLAGLGMILQYRMDPDIALKQLALFGIGIGALLVGLCVVRFSGFFRRVRWLLLLGSVALLLLVYFIGEEQHGAKNWMSIAGVSFQPSEFVKAALVFLLAHYLSEPGQGRLWVPLAFVLGCVGMLMLERDLGAAVQFAGVSVITYYIATGNRRTTGLFLLAGGAAAVGSYYLFGHVRVRVAIWRNPWTSYSTSGYQIAQGLMAIASGGLWGTGLALGSPKLIPAYHTDYIFAVLCEELGIAIGLLVIGVYLLFTVRGILIALNAPNRFHALLAFGISCLIALQSLIILGGVTKLIPLTGITLPFMSHGGSSLITSMLLLGMLEGVACKQAVAKPVAPAILQASPEAAPWEGEEEERP